MTYRSMAGLGALETTKTGVAFHTPITCVTQGEHNEAASKCRVTELRGLGTTGYQNTGTMTGRLAAYAPCDILKMPVCPTPTCLDAYTTGLLFNCLSGGSVPEDFPCNSLFAGYLYGIPYCSLPANLPAIPKCYTAEQIALRSYCQQYGNMNGPDKGKNAICWLASHDKSYWDAALKVPECTRAPTMLAPPPVAPKPPAPPQPAPVTTAPPLPPPPSYSETTPGPITDSQYEPPSAPDMTDEAVPETSESGMAGMWGILALLAVAGGGYYMYRKHKR